MTTDYIEEAKIREHKEKISLKTDNDTCPYYVEDIVARCKFHNFKICSRELGNPCEIFGEWLLVKED